MGFTSPIKVMYQYGDTVTAMSTTAIPIFSLIILNKNQIV